MQTRVTLLLYLPVLLLISVAWAEDEIRVEREDDAVVVRSPMAKHNFLFRAPAAFQEATAPEGFQIALEAKDGDATARIRLRIGPLGADRPRALLERRAKEYGEGAPKAQKAGRWLVTAGARTVLVVFDGAIVYELFLDADPAGTPLAKSLEAVAAGFTILDPKGPPAGAEAAPTPEELAPKTLEKSYYRLKLLKPQGFAQQIVDPNSEPGIVYMFRRQDAEKNLCVIRIRVFLTKTLKKSVVERAQAAIDRFAAKYKSARVPRKPKRTRAAGAREAYALKLLGRVAKSGSVVQEDWKLIDHENGRLYEIQMTQYGGAPRVFRKDISAFWRKLKISNPK